MKEYKMASNKSHKPSVELKDEEMGLRIGEIGGMLFLLGLLISIINIFI